MAKKSRVPPKPMLTHVPLVKLADEGRSFLRATRSGGMEGNPHAWQVFADWLEEQGHPYGPGLRKLVSDQVKREFINNRLCRIGRGSAINQDKTMSFAEYCLGEEVFRPFDQLDLVWGERIRRQYNRHKPSQHQIEVAGYPGFELDLDADSFIPSTPREDWSLDPRRAKHVHNLSWAMPWLTRFYISQAHELPSRDTAISITNILNMLADAIVRSGEVPAAIVFTQVEVGLLSGLAMTLGRLLAGFCQRVEQAWPSPLPETFAWPEIAIFFHPTDTGPDNDDDALLHSLPPWTSGDRAFAAEVRQRRPGVPKNLRIRTSLVGGSLYPDNEDDEEVRYLSATGKLVAQRVPFFDTQWDYDY